MRLLARNKKELWYANRVSESYVTDANGLKTGEKTQEYGTPVKVRMSIFAAGNMNAIGAQNGANLDPYGITHQYTYKAIIEGTDCPMDEECRVWFGIKPTRMVEQERTVNGRTVTVMVEVPVPHNFKVLRKAPGLNQTVYYLKEADVS